MLIINIQYMKSLNDDVVIHIIQGSALKSTMQFKHAVTNLIFKLENGSVYMFRRKKKD